MPRASVDIAAFYGALDRQRQAEGLSWRGLGRMLEIPASTFTRLSQGAGPDVDAFAVLLHWLGKPVSVFLDPPQEDAVRETEERDTVDAIGVHLRSDQGLTPEAAEAIERMVRVAYQTLQINRRDPV